MSNTKKCSKGKGINYKTQKCVKFRNMTKKQGIRLENSILRKTDKQIYDIYVKKYNTDKSLDSNLRLIEESKIILKNIDEGGLKSNNTLEELEIQYEALSHVMEQRLLDSYANDNNVKIFSGYPDYEDPEFNEKISRNRIYTCHLN